MSTISKTLTTSGKSLTITDGNTIRGVVAFVDQKGQRAGQCMITIAGGKVAETGQTISTALSAALATVVTEFGALVDSMVAAGSLDPMARPRPPVA